MLLVLLCLEDVTTLFLRVWKSILAVWFPITLYEKRAWKYLNPSYRGREKKPSRYNVTKTKTNNELNVSCKGDYGIKFIVNVFQVLHWHSQVNGFVWTVWNKLVPNSSGLLKKDCTNLYNLRSIWYRNHLTIPPIKSAQCFEQWSTITYPIYIAPAIMGLLTHPCTQIIHREA